MDPTEVGARGTHAVGPASPIPGARRRRSGGVVKDHAERVSLPRVNPAHAMPHRYAMIPAGAAYRAMIRGEDERLPPVERDDLAARLGAGTLLHEQALAALEIDTTTAERPGHLERKRHGAVEVLM